jgi:hypothetical protein
MMFKLSLLAVSLMVAGCVAPAFKPPTHVPSDKALVYLYRKPSVYGGPAHKIYANQKSVAVLNAGNYYPYWADPGDVKFTVKQQCIGGSIFPETIVAEISVEAGRTYYLSHDIAYGFGPAIKLKYSLKDDSVGLRQMTHCKLAECLETNSATK